MTKIILIALVCIAIYFFYFIFLQLEYSSHKVETKVYKQWGYGTFDDFLREYNKSKRYEHFEFCINGYDTYMYLGNYEINFNHKYMLLNFVDFRKYRKFLREETKKNSAVYNGNVDWRANNATSNDSDNNGDTTSVSDEVSTNSGV